MKNDELLLLENPFTCRDKYYKRRIRLSICVERDVYFGIS